MHFQDSNTADNLEKLDGPRRDAIVDAAIDVFGKSGYRHAHTQDIARAAGMSKSALFFYFRNKRSLYEFVVDVAYERAAEAVIDERFWEIDDFFERMLYIGEQKRGYFDAHPRLTQFALRAFYPTHRDVRRSMSDYSYGKVDEMLDRFFRGVDFTRFRDEVEPAYIASMMVWLADGWMHEQLALCREVEMGPLMEQFRKWCDMLRAYAYREEHL